MPEIARFFGIIIRMFAEPAAPHHRPHFHAYSRRRRDLCHRCDRSEAICHAGSSGWWKRGLSFTRMNCSWTGSGCRLVAHRSRSNRSGRR